MSRDIAAVDLFCGPGGLTHGLQRAGIRVQVGVDLDAACRFPYEANNNARFWEMDVHGLTGEQVSCWFPSDTLRLVAGCAPCQPFSTYSRKVRQEREDQRWSLVRAFGRIVRDVEPELVTMENVPQLADHQVFGDLLHDLRDYKVSVNRVRCEAYGIPQTRKRLVLLASRLGPISLLPPDGPEATVREAIGALPPLAAGENDPLDSLHAACRLSEVNLARIRASIPGGTWRDWSPELRAACHRRPEGATYPSVYGRMAWDEPSPTITTQCYGFGSGRFGHPAQDRAISLREAALLQTFPREYRFLPRDERPRFNVLGRMIGNAVPVRLGEVIGHSLREHVERVA